MSSESNPGHKVLTPWLDCRSQGIFWTQIQFPYAKTHLLLQKIEKGSIAFSPLERTGQGLSMINASARHNWYSELESILSTPGSLLCGNRWHRLRWTKSYTRKCLFISTCFLALLCSTWPVRHVETMWTGISSRRPWPWPITTRLGAHGCIFHVEQIISFRTSQRCRWLCPTPKSTRNLHYRRQLITWWMCWRSFLAKT